MSELTMEIWQWLHEPIRQLNEQSRSESELTWEERLPDFLSSLGVTSVDDHPVLRLLADDVTHFVTEEERTAFLADDALDTHVFALVERVAAEYPDESGDAEYSDQTDDQTDVQAGEQPGVVAPTVEQVVDQAVREAALPVLTEVAASWPHVLADVPTAVVAEAVSRLLAARLATAWPA